MEQIIKKPKLALSIPEAAELLSISDTAMRQLARTKGFPSFKMGTRLLVLPYRPFGSGSGEEVRRRSP